MTPRKMKKKDQFGPFLLQDCRLEIVIDTVANATDISSLVTKNSRLVAIIQHNGDYISLCWQSVMVILLHMSF